ncbi:acyl-CoA dehydrogenase family protein [Kitasatospora sp. MMS16-BH015]|uniref:acyl-CoA dehydrogenase family protein n=1 Tax=Kitasatospora sp. MMS16-BH015 TaxID=2018025 RepID=UPI0020C1EF78|nr:acyl-CoA dehydrogenase family protein [Kitasatospora sp. MMS16-BH015]
MDLLPDPLFTELRTTLRKALAGLAPLPDLHGAPVADGAQGPTRPVLDTLSAAEFERPASAGGLGLGLTAGALVSEELGRAACGNSYRAGALAASLGVPGGAVAPAGTGGGLLAAPVAEGWELTGAATAEEAGADRFLVLVRAADGEFFAEVERGAAGVTVADGCWPPVLRLDRTPVAALLPAGASGGAPAELSGGVPAGSSAGASAGVFGAASVAGGGVHGVSGGAAAPSGGAVFAGLDESAVGPLARARVRQAAYLLGIAAGAHREAVEYAGHRRQFGTRLRDLPAVSFPLARGLVSLRATRAAVYRAAWLVDAEPAAAGTAPAEALATAAETAREVVRGAMQTCGVRAMTTELGLHRYYRLTAAESVRYGDPAALWREVGAARLREAKERAAVQPA